MIEISRAETVVCLQQSFVYEEILVLNRNFIKRCRNYNSKQQIKILNMALSQKDNMTGQNLNYLKKHFLQIKFNSFESFAVLPLKPWHWKWKRPRQTPHEILSL